MLWPKTRWDLEQGAVTMTSEPDVHIDALVDESHYSYRRAIGDHLTDLYGKRMQSQAEYEMRWWLASAYIGAPYLTIVHQRPGQSTAVRWMNLPWDSYRAIDLAKLLETPFPKSGAPRPRSE